MKKKMALVKKLYHNCGIQLAAYSFCAGVLSRLGLKRIYKFFSRKRFEKCEDYLKTIENEIYKIQIESQDVFCKDLVDKQCIWTMWYQGYDNAPQIVKCCLDSIKKYSNGHKVVIVDKENLEKYIKIPQYMKKKYEEGQISFAHYSDYIRVELLLNYGGAWIDSTCKIINDIPEEIFNVDFFTVNQGGIRNWVASKDKWSVCVMAAKTNNLLIRYCRNFELFYWKEHDFPITYLLLDCFIALAYDNNLIIKHMIDEVPLNNEYMFYFVEEGYILGNQEYIKEKYKELVKNTWIFKFTYKQEYKKTIKGMPTMCNAILEK